MASTLKIDTVTTPDGTGNITFSRPIVADGAALTNLPAGSGWNFVSSATASGSASLAFTNMIAGYDYEYVFNSLVSASNTVELNCQLGVSGPTYRTSGYAMQCVGVNTSGTSYSTEETDSFVIVGPGEGMGTGTDEGLRAGSFTLSDPATSSTKTGAYGFVALFGASPQPNPQWVTGFYQATAEANVACRFLCSSGNITSGTVYQYRRSLS